jgi:hypothetical protein
MGEQRDRVGVWIVAASIGIVLASALSGCSAEPWQPREFRETGGDSGGRIAEVFIYSPSYGRNARGPDDVAILWDGKELFTGRLPVGDRDITGGGGPIELLHVTTIPGEHILRVVHEEEVQSVRVRLESGFLRRYLVLGVGRGLVTELEGPPLRK